MKDVCSLIWLALIGLFRSQASLQAEILTLRHQLNVLRRKSPQRLTFTSIDRLVFAGLYRLAPGVLDALKIVRPETVIRWHRAGFRAYFAHIADPNHAGLVDDNECICIGLRTKASAEFVPEPRDRHRLD